MAYEKLQDMVQGNGVADNINVGGKSYTNAYANDVNNQEEMRLAVVNANNNVSYTNKAGTYDNITNQRISPQQPIQQQPQVTNNSSQISDMYAQSLAASQAALKASIQQSMGTYNREIQKAPGTYQPLRDQASYSGAKTMQNLQEMIANGGQQGGVNRTEETQVNSNTENNINSLNRQQQSVIDTANQAISDLQAQGDIKGAELVAQNASERIRALIEESNRVDSLGYSRGRDTLADTRYNAETAYNQGRDALSDIRYNDTTAYNQAQDTIQNTGKLADGTFTQSGQMNDTNIKTGELQLRELTDPNSTTNQIAKLGLDTAKLNYAALPQQLKSEAQVIAQQLSKGTIDIKTAQIQLDYLPQMMQAELRQTNAQIAASNRSNQPSGNNGAPSPTKSALAPPTVNGNGATDNVNRTAADIDNIVKATGYNKEDRLASLNTMLEFYSAQGGTQSEYMINYINQGVRTIKGQKSL